MSTQQSAKDKSIYRQLPEKVTSKGEDFHHKNRLFGYLSKPLVDDLAKMLNGRKVLEVYAGRGHLSAALKEKGVDIKTTSLQMGHDGSYEMGHVADVEFLRSDEAIHKYNPWMNTLLVCWPTTDGNLARALQYLPDDALIVFIGEVTDYTVSPPVLGGCATDEFFAAVEEVSELTKQVRYPTPRTDKFKVYRKRGSSGVEPEMG